MLYFILCYIVMINVIYLILYYIIFHIMLLYVMLKIIKFTLYCIMMFIVMLGILKFKVTAIEKVMIYIFKKTCKMKRDLKNRLFMEKSTRNQKFINFFFFIGCYHYGGSCANEIKVSVIITIYTETE